jgi:hypothetical protein
LSKQFCEAGIIEQRYRTVMKVGRQAALVAQTMASTAQSANSGECHNSGHFPSSYSVISSFAPVN